MTFWPNTMTIFHRSTLYQSVTCLTNSTLYWLMKGFHRTFATGVACWQGTLTLPDTWSRPIWDLHMFYLLRPILFSNLSLFFRTMNFEYPSVLSRFCLSFETLWLDLTFKLSKREFISGMHAFSTNEPLSFQWPKHEVIGHVTLSMIFML